MDVEYRKLHPCITICLFLRCDVCPAREFAAGERNTECTFCDPGRYTPDEGKSRCVSCEPGQFASSEGNTTCTRCSPGQFASESGMSGCSLTNIRLTRKETGRFADLEQSSGYVYVFTASFFGETIGVIFFVSGVLSALLGFSRKVKETQRKQFINC